MNKKLFAFDLDGTLLSGEHNYLEETKQAIEKIKKLGHIPIIATGRPLGGVYKIDKIDKLFDYAICNDGSMGYDLAHKKEDFTFPIDESIIKKIFAIVKKHHAFFWIHTPTHAKKVKTSNEKLAIEDVGIKKGWFKRDDIIHADEIDIEQDLKNVIQIYIWANEEVAAKIREEITIINDDVLNILLFLPHYIVVNKVNHTKLSAVKYFAKKHNILDEDIYAFGDGDNDIKMLQGIKNSYAMENGRDEVKQSASEVIGPNTEPSIANVINKILG